MRSIAPACDTRYNAVLVATTSEPSGDQSIDRMRSGNVANGTSLPLPEVLTIAVGDVAMYMLPWSSTGRRP